MHLARSTYGVYTGGIYKGADSGKMSVQYRVLYGAKME